MMAEGKRLIARVQKVDLTSEVQRLIQDECDNAFAKNDVCPPGTKIEYLPDMSSSMSVGGDTSPWNQQLQFAKGVFSQAIAYDDEGIDIWPIRNTYQLQKLSNPNIEKLLKVTHTEKALDYMKGYENKLGTTPTRNLFSRRVEDVV